MLKIDENSGYKGVRKVKKCKWVMIYINTFYYKLLYNKVLSGKCKHFVQFTRRKGGEGKR